SAGVWSVRGNDVLRPAATRKFRSRSLGNGVSRPATPKTRPATCSASGKPNAGGGDLSGSTVSVFMLGSLSSGWLPRYGVVCRHAGGAPEGPRRTSREGQG